MLVVRLVRLAPHRPARRGGAVRHLDHARLAIELEEDTHLPLLVRVAHGLQAHDERFALLDGDGDVLAYLHAVEEHRRRVQAAAINLFLDS